MRVTVVRSIGGGPGRAPASGSRCPALPSFGRRAGRRRSRTGPCRRPGRCAVVARDDLQDARAEALQRLGVAVAASELGAVDRHDMRPCTGSGKRFRSAFAARCIRTARTMILDWTWDEDRSVYPHRIRPREHHPAALRKSRSHRRCAVWGRNVRAVLDLLKMTRNTHPRCGGAVCALSDHVRREPTQRLPILPADCPMTKRRTARALRERKPPRPPAQPGSHRVAANVCRETESDPSPPAPINGHEQICPAPGGGGVVLLRPHMSAMDGDETPRVHAWGVYRTSRSSEGGCMRLAKPAA